MLVEDAAFVKFIGLTKSQADHFESLVLRYTPTHPRYEARKVALYQDLAQKHRELERFLVALRLQHASSPLATSQLPVFSLQNEEREPPKPEGFADLPEELLKELSGAATKGQVDVLVTIIDQRGGTANLDEILIDLFRKHGEVGKRIAVGNKLYRLMRRNLVWAVPNRKGYYTTREPDLSTLRVVEFKRET